MKSLMKKIRSAFSMPNEVDELESTLEEIRAFTRIGFAGFQDIRTLTKHWPVGVAKSIQGSDTMLVEKSDTSIKLISRIPVGHSFPIHWHDLPETCEVLAGQMDDVIEPIKMLKKGDSYTYAPYVKHQPRNASTKDNCIVLVTFKI